ncbi:hypothetical protein PybrP1_000335 [[Pythium] brassicae (nom. inval.)]|nr:hypothetical protein PybrP1_000335 [[Pythium] brassicae (nom. inval.)]
MLSDVEEHEAAAASSDDERGRRERREAHDEEDAANRKRQRRDAAERIKKARARGFLEQSQMSETDRRRVRFQERELLVAMKENADELAKLSSDSFRETSQQLDQMYDNVCYPREANLDASNLDELNVAVAKQSQALGASDLTKYDVADLIRATRQACGADAQFDWATLGAAAGACFRAAPEINFLFGLMGTEVVQKERKRARRVRADSDEETKNLTQPTEYTSKKDRKDAQARRLEVLQGAMTESRKKHLFDVVVNPSSFTQTVENLFDMSFLVRNGAVEIGIDDSGLPYLENHEGRSEETIPAQTQSIISITPAQWEAIASVWGVDEPLVGHRS